MDAIGKLLGGTLGIIWVLGGPITYIISVVDTWQGSASIPVKIILSLTLDAFMAAIWPGTWIAWFIFEAAGSRTPLSTVLGLG